VQAHAERTSLLGRSSSGRAHSESSRFGQAAGSHQGADGDKQIAGDPGLSEITVKVHRGHVMRKMQAKSIADLVRIADKLGLSVQRSKR
jgi:hypothetical protein